MVSKRLVIVPLVIATLGVGSAAAAAELVVNGDFSAGNTGFSTDYSLTTMTPYLFQNAVHGIYAIETASSIAGSSAYGDWTNISTDPTGGDGNVYVSDGATNANETVWSETVAVKANSNYTFSFYGAEVSNPCCSNATFQGSINGTVETNLNTTGSWQQASVVWNSGSNTTATLALTDTNLSGPYNDFAIDDISLVGAAAPEPSTWAVMLIGFCGLGALMRRRGVATAT